MSTTTRSRRQHVVSAAVLLLLTTTVPRDRLTAQQSHDHDSGLRADPAGCTDATLSCASYATPFFDRTGRLWLAWSGNGHVGVSVSTDRARSFAPPVLVTREAVRLDNGPDERPQVVVDGEGRVAVAFAIFKDDRMNGQIFTAASVDGGRSFGAPRPITDDGSSQRFVTLNVDPDGTLFAAWIDKRHVVAARAAGTDFAGASLAVARSHDGGARFDVARIAKDNICECCRLAVAPAGAGRPAVVFRNIFGGERDHAVITFAADGTPGPVSRVSEDHWAIDACPHHGPSLAIADDGSYHVAWFSGGGVRQGAFYARSTDGGRSFSTPVPLADTGHRSTRPYVRTQGSDVWLAWKEFDGERTSVLSRVSHDRGTTWGPARIIAGTSDFSDHPILTRLEGYRLIPLTLLGESR